MNAIFQENQVKKKVEQMYAQDSIRIFVKQTFLPPKNNIPQILFKYITRILHVYLLYITRIFCIF